MLGPSTSEKFFIWSFGWAYNRRVKTTFPEKLEGIVSIIFWNPILLMRSLRLIGYLFCRRPVFLSPETFRMFFVILRELEYHQAVSNGFTGLWFCLLILLDTWAFSIWRFRPFFSLWMDIFFYYFQLLCPSFLSSLSLELPDGLPLLCLIFFSFLAPLNLLVFSVLECPQQSAPTPPVTHHFLSGRSHGLPQLFLSRVLRPVQTHLLHHSHELQTQSGAVDLSPHWCLKVT